MAATLRFNQNHFINPIQTVYHLPHWFVYDSVGFSWVWLSGTGGKLRASDWIGEQGEFL
jgi:hypothetical protein